MKKEEALQIAPERSKLLCEYITQILMDKETVNGKISIDSYKINNEKMLTFEITVPKRGFERHFNTGITTQQVDILTEQILNDLIDNFMLSETMECSRYYSVKGGYGININGINIINNIESLVNINFRCRWFKFSEKVDNYNLRLYEYINKQEN